MILWELFSSTLLWTGNGLMWWYVWDNELFEIMSCLRWWVIWDDELLRFWVVWNDESFETISCLRCWVVWDNELVEIMSCLGWRHFWRWWVVWDYELFEMMSCLRWWVVIFCTRCEATNGAFLACYRNEDQSLLTLSLADGQVFKSTSIQVNTHLHVIHCEQSDSWK